jgi:hypothetical protein
MCTDTAHPCARPATKLNHTSIWTDQIRLQKLLNLRVKLFSIRGQMQMRTFHTFGYTTDIVDTRACRGAIVVDEENSIRRSILNLIGIVIVCTCRIWSPIRFYIGH